MSEMSLKTLCSVLGPAAVRDLPVGMSVTGIACDSRKVGPGVCFVAVEGYETDGHGFVDHAIARGAVAVIVQKPVGKKHVPLIRVKDSRKALAVLSARFYGDPSKTLDVIGITGTNGKTTSAILVEAVLAHGGIMTGLLGTVTMRWKGHEIPAERTTPESVDLQRILHTMKSDGIKAVVMEVSSHALSLHRVYGISFRAAVFTNLSRDHLDFHGSIAEYRKAKAKLFRMLASDGFAVIGADDPASRTMIKATRGRAVTFGMDNPRADYRIRGIELGDRGSSFSLVRQDRTFRFFTSLPGRFNVANSAAAAVVGLEMGLGEAAVQAGIRSVNRVPGRMERIDSGRGFGIIVDFAHTPEALKNVLGAAREITRNRLIVVFGCGGNRDRGKRPLMGKAARSLADLVVVTSDNPRREDPAVIVEEILSGMDDRSGVEMILDRKQAIRRALERAAEGDIVVVAGKGHETYQEIGTQRIPFDDRTTIENNLRTL